jgi:hypothetical protein
VSSEAVASVDNARGDTASEGAIEHLLRWLGVLALVALLPSVFFGHFLHDICATLAAASGWIYVARSRARNLPYTTPMRIVAWCGTAWVVLTSLLALVLSLLLDWTM